MVDRNITLKKFLTDVYVRFHPQMNQNSIKAMGYQLNSFLRFCDQKGLPKTFESLNEQNVVDYSAWCVHVKKRSPQTCNAALRAVGCIWREGLKRGYTDTPCEIHKMKTPSVMPEAWFPGEFDLILKAASKEPGTIGPVPAGIWWCGLILTVYWTGSRITAAMRIRSSAVNLDEGFVLLPHEEQKTNRDELRDIPPEVCDLLRAFDKDRNENLFGDWAVDGRRKDYHRGDWKVLWKRYGGILERAGLPNGPKHKFHKIRRTFGTRIAAAAGRAVAQELLGHQYESTTKLYIDPRQVPRKQATKIIAAPGFDVKQLIDKD